MTTIFQAIILGIIQGITEWLPISSSGHLALAQHYFGISQPIVFDIILHLGSLVVVLIVFWKEIVNLAKGIFKGEKKSWTYFMWLVIATIPIGLVGVFLNDLVKSTFTSISFVGGALIFTGVILFLSKYSKPKKKKLSFRSSFVMGILQSLAIFPGVSRSGMTISTGLMQGVNRKEVATFSFLLFIPAILGATVFEFSSIGSITNFPALIVGVITTIVVGYLSLKLLLKVIENQKFWYFSIYCVVIGLLVLLLV